MTVPGVLLILNDLMSAPQHVRLHLASNDLFCPGSQIIRKDGLFILDLGFKPEDAQAVFHGLVYGIAVSAFCHFIIKLGQYRALVHNLPFMHKHGAQDAALKVLDCLGALRANDRAFGMGYFIHAGNSSPKNQAQKKHAHANGQCTYAKPRSP